MARFTALTDKLLSRFVESGDAGACVAENGQYCVNDYRYKCENGSMYRKTIHGRFNCYGSCVATGETSSWIKIGGCI